MTGRPAMAIGDREIGPGRPTYIIAELSANHQGDLGRAVELVHLAKQAGADAVKLQTYTPETMTLQSDKPWFRVGEGTIWEGRRLYDLYGEAHTPWEWHEPLRAAAETAGIDFFSTAFDDSAVEFLEALDVPMHKIASFELVDLPLIRRAASTGKPLIMSTGMASVAEIDEAVGAARSAGTGGIALLRCNSAYPAPPAEMDLRTIPHMAALWDVPVGLSDHTLGMASAVAAVALGACILEKHFTLTRAEPGPDSSFSSEPSEFKAMVEAVREAEAALGSVRYGPAPHEQASVAFRRSLFVVEPVKAGEPLTERNVRALRPCDGLAPKLLDLVLTRRAAVDLEPGTPLSWELLA